MEDDDVTRLMAYRQAEWARVSYEWRLLIEESRVLRSRAMEARLQMQQARRSWRETFFEIREFLAMHGPGKGWAQEQAPALSMAAGASAGDGGGPTQ